MKLSEIVRKLELDVMCGEGNLDCQVKRGYVSDLMSDVLANAREGDLWITLQVHQNVVAVAGMKEIAAVVLIGGRKPEEQTLEKAKREDIPILSSELPAFELVGKLYELGVPGL
ncbi:MAG TPA: DRTGG domain-containing protein [Spirochaetia bacterium]|nr:DRTGG domain-containing protein [Spirochaetia bacterium]